MAHMSKSGDFGGMSAQDATYQWLRQYIATMPRSDGNFITESEVAATLGTSRTPVREALLRLETEGYLQILPKKGAYVPAISDAEAEAVMHARCMVEDWCARGISSNAAEVAAELGKLIEEQEKLITDPAGFIECDRQFHRVFVGASGNQVIASFYETLRDRQVRMGLQAVAASHDRAQIVLGEHRAIVEALRDHGPNEVAEAVETHLQNTWDTLISTGMRDFRTARLNFRAPR